MENEKEIKTGFQIGRWKMLLPFLRPYVKTFVVIALTMALISVLDVIFPLFKSYAIDNFVEHRHTEGLIWFGVLYLAVVGLQCLLVVVFTRASMRVENWVSRDLKRAQFLHLQTLSLSYYGRTSVGYMVARVLSDSEHIARMISWGLVDALSSLSYLIFTLVAMVILNPSLSLAVLCMVPILVALTAVFQGRLLRANRKIRHINSQISGAYNEGITGVRTSKLLAIEQQNMASFAEITENMRVQSVRTQRMRGIYVPAVVFCGYLAAAIVLERGGNLTLSGAISLGTLSAFTTYAFGMVSPIRQLARTFSDVLSLQANLERVQTLLETAPDIQDTPEVLEKYGDVFHPKTENYEPIRGDIEFKDVSFKYVEGEYVLEHFDLKIPAGTTVAIVGDTGAGKSTLVNLACRFYEPTAGRVLIDGVDYRERSQHWLHSSLGYVLQDPHLFSGTILENIRYGRPDATDEEVYAAARAVSVDKIAERLDDGFDTQVGEGGGNLSGGQRQLISFARAVLADPRIFVLDEATSSVDTETESLIAAATHKLLQGRTSFIIAHRLSTIRSADVILVVRAGKIIERGNHGQLLAAGGEYASLYTHQFSDEGTRAALRGKDEISAV